LHQRRIAIGDGTTVTVRASVGLACYPEDGRTVEELISAADSRMYKEKEAAAAAE
jgi:diguanylate cyclase (GGDEF)-like protein